MQYEYASICRTPSLVSNISEQSYSPAAVADLSWKWQRTNKMYTKIWTDTMMRDTQRIVLIAQRMLDRTNSQANNRHNGTGVLSIVPLTVLLHIIINTRQVTRAPRLSLSRNTIINFQTGKRYKTIRHCLFLHTPYKRIGYVIIPKPHFQGVNV